MTRRLMMVLALVALAVAVPAVSASPASAASKCSFGEQRGPYWWGAAGANMNSWERKVMAVSQPWDASSTAYIWHDNNDSRQRWVMQCVGYSINRGRNIWQMRLASNTGLCLTDTGYMNAAALDPCQPVPNPVPGNDPDPTLQMWEMVPGPTLLIEHDGGYQPTSAFFGSATGFCLDVSGGNAANGTPVISFPCTSGSNQQWY
jgi:hypothetical protein